MELIKIENNIALLNPETSKQIADYEKAIKVIKEQEEQLKQRILDEMKANNIVKIDTDDLTINYVAETYREDFDKTKFKKENPKLYDEYIKITPVKENIRIKVK